MFLLTVSVLNITSHKIKVRTSVVLAKGNVSEKANLDYWNQFVKNNPTYYKGWLEIAKIEFENGNYLAAKNALYMAKDIAPNSSLIDELETEINKVIIEEIQQRNY